MTPMPPFREYTGRSLIIAFAAVTLSFLGATLYTQYTSAQIDTAADVIGSDTSPSIEHLEAMRAEANRVQFLLADYMDQGAEAGPATRDAIDQGLSRMNAEVAAYLMLPTGPGETKLWGDMQQALVQFSVAVDRALTQVERNSAVRAQETFSKDVRPSANRLSDAALLLIELNARMGRAAAVDIKVVRHRAVLVGWALDILCTLVAAIAALLVRHEVRRSAAVAEAYSRLQKERADELEAFAGRMAHDILNPLHAVSLSLDMATRHPENQAMAHEVLTRGQRNVRRIQSIIDGLLAFARAGAKPEPGAHADLAECLTEAVHAHQAEADAAGVELMLEPLPACAVACSRGVLLSLASNLLQNAVKYVADAPVRRVTARAVERGGKVHVEVSDTGPGLPEGLAATVFEPYVRASGLKQPGIGLGLATVRRLAEGHGGAVGLRSMPGHGCTFWFELPRAAAAPAPEVRAPGEPSW
jgi:signal transduction histidine kinase